MEFSPDTTTRLASSFIVVFRVMLGGAISEFFHTLVYKEMELKNTLIKTRRLYAVTEGNSPSGRTVSWSFLELSRSRQNSFKYILRVFTVTSNMRLNSCPKRILAYVERPNIYSVVTMRPTFEIY